MVFYCRVVCSINGPSPDPLMTNHRRAVPLPPITPRLSNSLHILYFHKRTFFFVLQLIPQNWKMNRKPAAIATTDPPAAVVSIWAASYFSRDKGTLFYILIVGFLISLSSSLKEYLDQLNIHLKLCFWEVNASTVVTHNTTHYSVLSRWPDWIDSYL